VKKFNFHFITKFYPLYTLCVENQKKLFPLTTYESRSLLIIILLLYYLDIQAAAILLYYYITGLSQPQHENVAHHERLLRDEI